MGGPTEDTKTRRRAQSEIAVAARVASVRLNRKQSTLLSQTCQSTLTAIDVNSTRRSTSLTARACLVVSRALRTAPHQALVNGESSNKTYDMCFDMRRKYCPEAIADDGGQCCTANYVSPPASTFIQDTIRRTNGCHVRRVVRSADRACSDLRLRLRAYA